MGTIQPELFYIPWGHRRKKSGNIFVRAFNPLTKKYEMIKKIKVEMYVSPNNKRYIYDYDPQITTGNKQLYVPHDPPMITNYNDLQEILQLPDDDEQRINYEYGDNMLGFDRDTWIQYPWNWKNDFLKHDEWVLADQYWENPESEPDKYIWVKNKNTPTIDGCEFEEITNKKCIMTFPSRDIVEIKNMPKGLWNITAYLDLDYEYSWTLETYVNSDIYAHNADYWRNTYVDMDFYDKWIEPYDTSEPPVYESKDDYYYFEDSKEDENKYQPSGVNNNSSLKYKPYNTDPDSNAPEFQPLYSDKSGNRNYNAYDNLGYIPTGWSAPENALAINVSSDGEPSLYKEFIGYWWNDIRYKGIDNNNSTQVFNYFYGISHPLEDNTICYRVNPPGFGCLVYVYQEMPDTFKMPMSFYRSCKSWGNGGLEQDIPYGDTGYSHYEGGCIFEVMYDDGTKAYFEPTCNNRYPTVCSATLQLKKGKNIIKSYAAPFYSGSIRGSSLLDASDPMSGNGEFERFVNDDTVNVVTIAEEDLDKIKNNTYVAESFNYYYASPGRVTIELVPMGLPPGVSVKSRMYKYYPNGGYYEVFDPQLADFTISSYNYSTALKFYFNGHYYGYFQAGFAPFDLVLSEGYGKNENIINGNNDIRSPIVYCGSMFEDVGIRMSQYEYSGWSTSANLAAIHKCGYPSYVNIENHSQYYTIIDTEDGLSTDQRKNEKFMKNRLGICCQSMLGSLKVEKYQFANTRMSGNGGHGTNALIGGKIVLFQGFDGTYDSGQDRCGLIGVINSNSSHIVDNYLDKCNCLNETGGFCNNPYNQQYYYLGDNLTKELAREFFGCYMFRNGFVDFVSSIPNDFVWAT